MLAEFRGGREIFENGDKKKVEGEQGKSGAERKRKNFGKPEEVFGGEVARQFFCW